MFDYQKFWTIVLPGLLTITGCLPKLADAKLKVAAGCEISKLENSQDYAAVVKVSHQEGESRTSSCTATWVSDQTLLTAWHCLPKDNGQVFVQSSNGEKIFSLEIKTYDKSKNGKSNSDIAVVRFKEGTFKGEPLGIDVSSVREKKGPQAAEMLGKGKVIIIGFGKTDHNDINSSGKKTFGYVDQPYWDDVNKSFAFKGYKSDRERANGVASECGSVANTQGDSGGPLIHNKVVYGVASSHRDDGIYLHGIYASTAFNLALLRESKFPIKGLTEGDFSSRPGDRDSNDDSIDEDRSSPDRIDGQIRDQNNNKNDNSPHDFGGENSRGELEGNGGGNRSGSCSCGVAPGQICFVKRGSTPVASTPFFGSTQCRDECAFLMGLSSVKAKCQ